MLTFTFAISCLTTSNLPWFVDLTFQVPMQYCSLQHQTLLLSPVTSTARYCFCFGSIPSFFLELFLHWSPVAYWALTDLGSSSFSILSFCLFILFMGFSRQEYWSGLPFPSPVHICYQIEFFNWVIQSFCVFAIIARSMLKSSIATVDLSVSLCSSSKCSLYICWGDFIEYIKSYSCYIFHESLNLWSFITSLSNSEMPFLWVQDHEPTHPFESLEVALGATATPRNDVQGGKGTQDRENVVMMQEAWHGGWTWHAGRGRRMKGPQWLTVSHILACLMLVYRRGPILYSYWGSTAPWCYVSD